MGFGHYVFGILGNEIIIIMQYYLVPCRLSSDSGIKFCFLRRFGWLRQSDFGK